MLFVRFVLFAALAVILGCYPVPPRRAVLFSDPPVTGDFESVYLLSRDNPSSTGSAFLVVHGGRQYLVTSRSVITGLYPNRVDIRTTTSKVTVPIRRSWLSESSDLGVIILDQPLPRRFQDATSIATTDEFNLATEAWTLGFPSERSVLSGTLRPAPILGHAYFAGMISPTIMGFDGRAYPGAIGGPIIMRNREGVLRIAAVITGNPESRIPSAIDTVGNLTHLMYAAPLTGLSSILDSLVDAPKDLVQ